MIRRFGKIRITIGTGLLLWFAGVVVQSFLGRTPGVFRWSYGIFGAALVSLFSIGYLISYRSLYPSDTVTDAYPRELLRYHARLFVAMRWLAISYAGLAIYFLSFVFVFVGGKECLPIVFCLLVAIGANGVYQYLGQRVRALKLFIFTQLLWDIGLFTVLIHYTGGIENPIIPLYLPFIIISGILLDRKTCYRLTGLTCLLYSLMAFGQFTGFLDHHELALFPHLDSSGEEEKEGYAPYDPWFVSNRLLIHAFVSYLVAHLVTEIISRLRKSTEAALIMARQAALESEKLQGVIRAADIGLAILEPHQALEWIEFAGIDEARDMLEETVLKLHRKSDGSAGPLSIEAEFAASGQPRIIYRVTVFPVHGQFPNPSITAALIQDITEQKNTAQQLIQSSKLAAVGELAGNMAHEINNPVGIIGAKARLLLADYSEGMSAKVRSETEKFIVLADRIAEITGELLRFARPQTGPLVRIDVNAGVENALALLNASLKNGGVSVVLETASPGPAIMGNANEFEQILFNLVANAIDAMPDGGILKISTAAGEDGPDGRAIIRTVVEDSGDGFPSDLALRIFEPFFSTKEARKGTGLGLAICTRIVEKWGGTIRAESDGKSGAQFIIEIPSA